MDRSLTLVELSRHEKSRQSLIFGNPFETIPCPNGFKLAAFLPDMIFGYERWRANDYGTISWQFLVLKTGSSVGLSQVSGVFPGADILFQTRGKDATKRALNWVRRMRKKDHDVLIGTPELSWRLLGNDRLLRRDFPVQERFLRGRLS